MMMIMNFDENHDILMIIMKYLLMTMTKKLRIYVRMMALKASMISV